MFSVADSSKPQRIALYARVSTEEQAERQTVDAQTDYLSRYSDLNDLPIAGIYVDDGVSGTVPLEGRPEGRRLLEDARAGAFTSVLITRVDRLARSLAVLMRAHVQFDACGVAVRSATEPFDSATPIGRFLFQLLGSMAELDRASTIERLNRGRDRVARAGKRASGTIPFGYDLNPEQRLVLSERIVPGTGQTEAEVMREVFERVAGGSSLLAETTRLGALGIVGAPRWVSGTERKGAGLLTRRRLGYAIHNPTYKGQAILDSRFGRVETPVPPLVPVAVWEAAQRQLVTNKRLSAVGKNRYYLLRGLVHCMNCGTDHGGSSYTGFTAFPKQGRATGYSYYRCGAFNDSGIGPRRCRAKFIDAEWLESYVWDGCKEFIHTPGPALADAQAALRQRLEESTSHEERMRSLMQQISDKDTEREHVMTLFRRGRATLEEAERQLDQITAERSQLRAMLDGLTEQSHLARAYEEQITSAAALLSTLRDEVEEIDRTNDVARKRQVIERLVLGVDVRTLHHGRPKQAEVIVRYAFGQPLQTTTENSSSFDDDVHRNAAKGSRRRALPARRW